MKRIALLIICVLCAGMAFSQSSKNLTIQGMVADSATKKPLEFAAITLTVKGNKKPVTGTITDSTGTFIITDAEEGSYTILIECIGYRPFTLTDITISKTSKMVNTGVIKLLSVNKTMDAVTVTSQARTIENKIDKLVFNAEKDISSQTGTASDILKKVPQVSVDADGNVQLAGSSGVRFLINGKPSTAFGSSVADVLQTIPASQIKSIEVITNPGAKYDAQGLGGIINIVLKTNRAKGYNGNLSLTAGTRSENGSLNLNARNNNFGANAFFSGNKRLKATVPFYADRTTLNGSGIDYLHQQGSAKFERQGFQTGFGFDWTIKKYNSFTGAVAYNDFGNHGRGYTFQSLEINKGNGAPPVYTELTSSNKIHFGNTDFSIGYKRTFAKEGRELELSANSSIGKGKTVFYNGQTTPQQSLEFSTQSTNPGKTKETQINLDYTEPLTKDIVLGTGGKVTFYDVNSSSSALKYDRASQSYITDNSLSTRLGYNQKVYAAYAELSFPLFSGISAKTGGRYERTEIDATYSGKPANVPGYNTFVPSLYFSKKINDAQTIKLSYSKRIERPDYNDLNPFVNATDPKNLSTGNPDLRSEYGHRIELSYTRDLGKGGSAMVNLFYRINDGEIQPYLIYYPLYNVGDSVYANVSVSTPQNVGTEKDFGANFFGDLHLTSKFGLRSNVFLFRRHTTNIIDKGFDTKSFNYRFNLNANYQATPTLVAEAFGNFNSARHEAQGNYPSFTTYSVAVRKQFWNKKGSLALTANNFAGRYNNQKTHLFGPGYDAINMRQIPVRSVGLNFTWKFGKLEFKKSKADTEGMNPAE